VILKGILFYSNITIFSLAKLIFLILL